MDLKREISKPSKLIKKFGAAYKGKINDAAGVEMIITSAYENDKTDLLQDAAFNAKYISGLIRGLNKAGANPEVQKTDHIKKDLAETTEILKEQIKEIIEGDSEAEDAFEKKYFEPSQDSFRELMALTADLESLKFFLNDLKRK